MLTAIDSFVTYLYAVLNDTLPVVFVRLDNSTTSGRMQADALNVRVLEVESTEHIERVMVSLDIVASNERQGWTWATQVKDALDVQTIHEYNYDTVTPVRTGYNVHWGYRTSFGMVGEDGNFVHLNCTLDLLHVS